MSDAKAIDRPSPTVAECHRNAAHVSAVTNEADLADLADIGDLSDIAAFDLSKLSNAGDEAALAAFLAAMPPDEAQAIEQGTYFMGSPAMASIRLRGVLDAAMRDVLTVGHLVALADRIALDAATAEDRTLLDAFDTADLTTADISATGFIIEQAGPFRAVAAVMLRKPRTARMVETMTRAAAVVSSVTAMLRERLQVLPDADELLSIGARFQCGDMTPADIAVVRALPGPYLRANASARHYAAIFVDYRLQDE